MKRKMTAAVLVLASMSSVQAVVIWEPVSQSASASQTITVDVDKSSIRQRDGMRQGWFRWNHMPSARTSDGKEFSSAAQLHLANCQQGEIALLQVTAYKEIDLQGDLVETLRMERSSAIRRLSEPNPESIGRAVLDALCRQK